MLFRSGAWRLGAAVVPINHKLQAPEVAYILRHCGSRLCIVDGTRAALIAAVQAELQPAAELRQGADVLGVEEVGGALLVATNWFRRIDDDWRLLHHQASPLVAQAAPTTKPAFH